MASGLEHAFFYASENHDRIYNVASFEYWLKKFFTTGVFTGDLQVTANDDMTVSLAGGYANVDGKVKFFEQSQKLQLETAHATYDRIDSIVIERNDSDRDVNAKVVTGGYSSNPTPLVPVRENGVYQLVVAQISVVHGAVKITQADITDTRTDTELCGVVAGTVQEMDFSQFSAQFDSYFENYKKAVYEEFVAFQNDVARLESEGQTAYEAFVAALNEKNTEFSGLFTTWFDSMKGQLSEDAAGNLQNEVDDINDGVSSKTQTKTTTFPEDGSIVETLADGRIKTTTFPEDGSIVETLTKASGEVIWKNVTTFGTDGSIKEEKVNG